MTACKGACGCHQMSAKTSNFACCKHISTKVVCASIAQKCIPLTKWRWHIPFSENNQAVQLTIHFHRAVRKLSFVFFSSFSHSSVY